MTTAASAGKLGRSGSALARAGGRLLYAGAKQKRLVLSDFRLAGTPDGLIEWQDQSETVLEVKSRRVGVSIRTYFGRRPFTRSGGSVPLNSMYTDSGGFFGSTASSE